MREIVQNNSPRWLETVDYYISRDSGVLLHNLVIKQQSIWFIKVFLSFHILFDKENVEISISHNANPKSQMPLG